MDTKRLTKRQVKQKECARLFNNAYLSLQGLTYDKSRYSYKILQYYLNGDFNKILSTNRKNNRVIVKKFVNGKVRRINFPTFTRYVNFHKIKKLKNKKIQRVRGTGKRR